MQLPSHKQWWSKVATHFSQALQCFVRSGYTFLKFYYLNESTNRAEVLRHLQAFVGKRAGIELKTLLLVLSGARGTSNLGKLLVLFDVIFVTLYL
jgi:hypothetical protein